VIPPRDCFCEHIGGYDKEDKAARAYDLAALKYWGTTTTTNFPVSKLWTEILLLFFYFSSIIIFSCNISQVGVD
jgi:hypothetical protein